MATGPVAWSQSISQLVVKRSTAAAAVDPSSISVIAIGFGESEVLIERQVVLWRTWIDEIWADSAVKSCNTI